MIVCEYASFATSAADDHAYLALKGIAEITADLKETRVVEGLMVSLLCEAFPAPGNIARRTADVDAALSVQIADSGTMHERLTAAGYVADDSNRYRSGNRLIDLLVPSGDHRFSQAEYGARAFDSAPGLTLALDAHPIEHRIEIVLSNGSMMRTIVRTPTVEHAVVLKAYASASRTAPKDYVDLHNLLMIANNHPYERLGGWRLNDSTVAGTRGDARHHLLKMKTLPGLRTFLNGTGVMVPVLTQLIGRHIG